MLRIKNIKIPVEIDSPESLLTKIKQKLHLNKDFIQDFQIVKKSLDARNKNNIFYLYEVDIRVVNEKKYLTKYKDVFLAPSEKYKFVSQGTKALKNEIIIVGSGPAGLFSAYLLTEQGYPVTIIERGLDIDNRLKCVNNFWNTNELNPNCNIQFGEGGAGTFSDGKLNTLVKDKAFRGKKVFEIFIENGAPKEIMYLHNPHIGTNLLRDVIKNMRNKIIARGGKILYNTTLTNIKITNNKITAIEINNKEYIPCEVLILAIGHSARDTITMLHKYLPMQAKPFAVGLRLIHSQKMLNEAQYGKYAQYLPPANYKLTYTSSHHRGVYSFCMCPGGYVINASSEPNGLVINGMSNHERDTNAANSAIVVSVTPDDFGTEPLDGIAFQRNLEQKAYKLGQGNIPLQSYKDFLNNQTSQDIDHTYLQLKGNYHLANLNNLLPEYITSDLKEGIAYFATKIKGFANPKTILLGVESRTSSPVRILRDQSLQSSIQGIYPCGEGAGYAGGITSAAMDGLKVAEEIAKIYRNN